ncbi:DUF1178 family protein [Limibaculum sp. FT325]|uniref:DUF1178 family protein n=1 Tax=Thermohalobaculum sediminis TaxID=2939436 RepID=UPI0020C0E47D|nr:DUF1178 family protein [Limibaculum sediminis]MCL5778219.1 DUF1178 family protein [Limibaculum sediminis]
MIRYALRCAHGHGFDAWFRNSSAFDEQLAAGQIGCAVCGEREVGKAVMAPSVVSGGAAPESGTATGLGLDRPASPLERALAELRRRIEQESDYVGDDFAAEARRIHEGESDQRPIWGEATLGDARALVEDGIPVAPLPFIRRRDD